MAEKLASGIIVYLQEELGDARLRAQQLAQFIGAAMELVEKSSHKDHFYEVAGHLLYGIPDTAFKLQKALDAAALAAARLDYEEIKQGLKPEKVEELEAALDDVRLRYLNRRSTEEAMNQKTASDILTQLADATEATGAVPVAKLARLIAALERGVKRASDQPARAAATFRAAAQHLLTAKNASRAKLAQNLRRILADSQMDPTAGAGEEFQKENPKITDEEVKKINEEHEKNKNVVKDKHAGLGVSTEDFLNDAERDLIGMASTMKRVMSGLNHVRGDLMDDRNPHMKGAIQKMTSGMSQLDSSLAQALDGLQDLLRLAQKGDPEFWDKGARFETGKPADPTKNMSPEDAEAWKTMNEKYRDVVKDQHRLCPRRS